MLREEITKAGKKVFSREFLYAVDTFLLKAELSKNEEDHSIHIIQFEYTFFNED